MQANPTDLDIIKRINKIEGLNIQEAAHYKRIVNGAGICTGFSPHNPLNDDDLCFNLMIKHGIQRVQVGDEWFYSIPRMTNLMPVNQYGDRKAICLTLYYAKHL